MIKIRRGAHANIWITFTCGEYKTTNKLPALCMSALIVIVKASFFFFFNHSTSFFNPHTLTIGNRKSPCN